MEATPQKMGPPGTGTASMPQLICGGGGQRMLKEAAISAESQPLRLLLGKEECIHMKDKDEVRPRKTEEVREQREYKLSNEQGR